MIRFTCTQCQYRLTASEDQVGQDAECPRCGQSYQVPSAAEAAAQAAASAATAATHPARLMPGTPARAQVDCDEIPFADEPAPSARTPRPAIAQQRAPVKHSVTRAAAPAATPASSPTAEVPLAEEAMPILRDLPEAIAPQAEESPPTPGGLVITPAGDVTIVSFHNTKVLDTLVIETIGKELYALVEGQGRKKIALDFSNVRFLSSQMLGVLMALHKKTTTAKGRLMLCSVQDDLRNIFRIVRLDRMVPILPDRATAVGVLGLP